MSVALNCILRVLGDGGNPFAIWCLDQIKYAIINSLSGIMISDEATRLLGAPFFGTLLLGVAAKGYIVTSIIFIRM